MGLIIKDGTIYGGLPFVELTMAQYNNLPEFEKNDNTLYFITDVNALPELPDAVEVGF